MVLYLSSGTDEKLFQEYQEQNYIAGGYQAQKFNSLIISGLSNHTPVTAISSLQFSAQTPEIKKKDFRNNGIRYICLGNNKGIFHKITNLREYIKYGRSICKTGKIEVVICDAINPLFSLAARILGKQFKIPTVAVVTDLPYYVANGKKTFFIRLTQYLMQRFDYYVLLTEAMNEKINRYKKPFIIMEGLCDYKKRADTKHNNNKFICVYTGSLSPNTGIENLVKAVSEMDEINFQLHIYGDGSLKNWLLEQTEECRNIKYFGLITNERALEIQAEANLLINPRPVNISYCEFSFPSKLMEYMASGTPVLSTKLPGIPEEYEPYMFWINDATPDGIKASLRNILELNEEVIAKKGLEAQTFVCNYKNKRYQCKRILNLIDDETHN